MNILQPFKTRKRSLDTPNKPKPKCRFKKLQTAEIEQKKNISNAIRSSFESKKYL